MLQRLNKIIKADYWIQDCLFLAKLAPSVHFTKEGNFFWKLFLDLFSVARMPDLYENFQENEILVLHTY